MGLFEDAAVRNAAFEWLTQRVDFHGDVLPYEELRQGFGFRGERVPLLGPQGIFKPRVLDLPLTITTAPKGPYADSFGSDGLLRYKYRGTDPLHPDNRGLRRAMAGRVPLIYLHGIAKGRYVPAWPVFIVGDAPDVHTFTVAVDDQAHLRLATADRVSDEAETSRRRYITTTVRQRIHQRAFRERVLDAYRSICAVCRLRHRELLEAAHITPDSDPEGEPVVTNGVSLCKMHHAAFDRQILGIRPDHVVEIRHDILEEIDGPMLLHGLQEMHGVRLKLPSSARLRPDPDRLAARYELFLGA